MVALAFLVPLAGLVDRLAEDRALTQAERDAQLVAQFVAATSGLTAPQDAFNSVTFEGQLAGRDVSLILPDGRIFGTPVEADESVQEALAGSTLRVATRGGQAVLVPSVGAGGDFAVVRVFVTATELHQGVTRSWLLLGLLSATLVTIGVAVTDRLARSIVAPVEELGSAAQRLGAGDFTARVAPDGPEEVAATGRQFNRLASEMARLIQSERETAADLSHRLRTPLMATRLGIDQILDPATRNELSRDLDEMERSIDHAIEELRRPSRLMAGEATILEDAVRDRAAFWAPLAEDQGRSVTVEIPFTATKVKLPSADLEAAIDALLGNVFAHTPEGTGYRVAVAIADHAVVTVSDDGPGFASDLAALRGRSTAESTGLGLDIARKTAESTGGSIRLGRSPTGGARIDLTFAIDRAESTPQRR
jgi:signal transduction histidine kinase